MAITDAALAENLRRSVRRIRRRVPDFDFDFELDAGSGGGDMQGGVSEGPESGWRNEETPGQIEGG